MPALPNVPQTLQVTFVMTLNEDANVINRIHFQYLGTAPSAAELLTLAGDASTLWDTHMAPQADANLILEKVEIVDLTSPTSASAEWIGALPGSAGGSKHLGAGTAARINRKITRLYRGGRPGVFWPVTDGDFLFDPQTLFGAYATAVQTGWSALETGIIADMISLWATGAVSVSVSYYSGFTTFTKPGGRVVNLPKLRLGGPVVDNITEIACNQRVASQRRRNLTRS